jgi:hypothetical protein
MASSNEKGTTVPGWVSYFSPYLMPPARASQGPGPILRARVWIRQAELDAALAGGTDPAWSEELELRAKQLVDRKTRNRLASGITHLIAIAEDQRRPAMTTPDPPFKPKQVEANRALLLELAGRLRGPRAVALRGMALISLLVEDGRGPLASDGDPLTLERAVRAALAALTEDPLPQQESTHPRLRCHDR